MNRPITTAELKPAVTTGPLPSSRKIFVTPDEAPDVRVPLREIILSKGAGEPDLPVYDTSGPYTDPLVTIDVNAGLARGRIAWVKERGGVEEYQGRDVKPVDNGNVSDDKAAAAFKAHHRPLRGLDGHMIGTVARGQPQRGLVQRQASRGLLTLPQARRLVHRSRIGTDRYFLKRQLCA